MLVQFEADNQSGLLKPGDYAQVSLGIPGAAAMLRLPASALMFRAAGLQVATNRYTDPGVYSVKLTVTNDVGETATYTRPLYIRAGPPTAYVATNGGNTIEVPQSAVYKTRVDLSSKGLPTSNDGYALLEAMAAGTPVGMVSWGTTGRQRRKR